MLAGPKILVLNAQNAMRERVFFLTGASYHKGTTSSTVNRAKAHCSRLLKLQTRMNRTDTVRGALALFGLLMHFEV